MQPGTFHGGNCTSMMETTTAYPARTKTATGNVNGTATDVTVTFFKDKILVTISQEGRLAQWVCGIPTHEL